MNRRKEVADNRAVSALFRVFGGAGPREIADGFERTSFRAMHRGERFILGLLVPLTVLVGLSEWLVKWCGPVAGWLLALPVAFAVTNLLAFTVPIKSVSMQWRFWLALLTAWAVWRMHAGGYVSAFAWLWIVVFALNFLATGLLGIRLLLAINGQKGVVMRAGLLVGTHVLAIVLGAVYGWEWALLGGLLIAAVYCAAVLNPYSQMLGPVLRYQDSRRILITIDDGPDPIETPLLLDLLDEHGAKAIFFMIGEKVQQHPELAREVIRRGHEIGNHTMTHPQATFWCATPERTRWEMIECQKAIEKATGEVPRWFRAPVGHRNLFTHPIAADLRLKVMGWNRRGFDAIQNDPRVVLRRIFPLTDGDIVLMHEGNGIAVKVLEGILTKKRKSI
jgi:peptidoglycan/xylan/chitin deacetylase (PgdA/CDA1 family)